MSQSLAPVMWNHHPRFGDFVDLSKWDITSPLSDVERAGLARNGVSRVRNVHLARFNEPLLALRQRFVKGGYDSLRTQHLMQVMYEMDSSFWLWDDEQWRDAVRRLSNVKDSRSINLALLPFLLAPSGLQAIPPEMFVKVAMHRIAKPVFGDDFDALLETIRKRATDAGYSDSVDSNVSRLAVVSRLVLYAGTTTIGLEHEPLAKMLMEKSGNKNTMNQANIVGKVLCDLNVFKDVATYTRHYRFDPLPIPDAWEAEIGYWYRYQMRLTGSSLKHSRDLIRQISRWFERNIPEVKSPADLTLDAVHKFRAAVVYAEHGEFRTNDKRKTKSGRLSVRTRGAKLLTLRKFIEDLIDLKRLPKEMHWLALELEQPKNFIKQMSRDPRVIEDAVYAKLLTAALELTPEDTKSLRYPFEMVRALAYVWLFGGMRRDEIRRLDIDCIQNRSIPDDEDESLVYIRVPANKFKSEFIKPVTVEVANAIRSWIAVRPKKQPKTRDSKTGEMMTHLFSICGVVVGDTYLNKSVIPLLARKAGVAGWHDRHGGLSSHRARSTIATLLGSGPNAMSLTALKEWLGHKNISTTLAYFATTPTELARQYKKAHKVGVHVYIDLDAVQSGNREAPWRFTEVAGGMCSSAPFASCPNNMSCLQSACEHHRPDSSEVVQRLRSGERAQRLVEEIALEPAQVKRLKGSPKSRSDKK